jgi:hypothetical protein
VNDQEQRMLAYATLAEESRLRGQQSGYLRFVILAGIAACRSGWSSVAARCRELVLDANPRHLLSNFGSLEEALRSEEFKTYLHHLDRFCTFERAEHLLEQMEFDWNPEEENFELESTVLNRLGKIG